MTPTPNVPAMTSEREALARLIDDIRLGGGVNIAARTANAILAAGFRRSAPEGEGDDGPDWACLDCGNTDRMRFGTKRYETMDGVDFDCECQECGSVHVAESHREAIHTLVEELDTLRANLPAPPSDTDKAREEGEGT
jgi:hypothetical protein